MVLLVSLGETITTAIVVFLALLAIGAELPFALLLAGLAPASAPAGALDIVQEGHAKGPLTETVLGVVALDDALGVMLFSLLLVSVEVLTGKSQPAGGLAICLWEILGGVLVGGLLALPMAWLTRKSKQGEPSILQAVGFVFLCGGIAIALNVSYLLACMAMGATVANRAKHRTRPFRDIQGISQPFLALFFLLAGIRLELGVLITLGIVGVVYVVARASGLILGGSLGARIAKAPRVVRSRIGWCLLPQAGVVLGLSLLVLERLPDLGASMVPLIAATTVIFEIFGPAVTMWNLRRANEL